MLRLLSPAVAVMAALVLVFAVVWFAVVLAFQSMG